MCLVKRLSHWSKMTPNPTSHVLTRMETEKHRGARALQKPLEATMKWAAGSWSL